MKTGSFLELAAFGARTVLFKRRDPILGTVIITDKCNLSCRHCSVNNITSLMHSYEKIRGEMRTLYDMGIRILFFCHGSR